MTGDRDRAAPVGSLVAAVGGAAVGVAYAELLPGTAHFNAYRGRG